MAKMNTMRLRIENKSTKWCLLLPMPKRMYDDWATTVEDGVPMKECRRSKNPYNTKSTSGYVDRGLVRGEGEGRVSER